jgi:hypothetical protein
MNKRTKDFVAKVSETDPLLASMLENIECLSVEGHNIFGNSANLFYVNKLNAQTTKDRLTALLEQECDQGCDTPVVVLFEHEKLEPEEQSAMLKQYKRLGELIALADEHHDGHLTIMKFTTHWKVTLGTLEGSYCEINKLEPGDTLEDAINKATTLRLLH